MYKKKVYRTIYCVEGLVKLKSCCCVENKNSKNFLEKSDINQYKCM